MPGEFFALRLAGFGIAARAAATSALPQELVWQQRIGFSPEETSGSARVIQGAAASDFSSITDGPVAFP
jgi:hypothetical protein